MIFINDSSGQIIYVGPEWTDLTGQNADQSLGLNWLKKVHPDDRALVEDTRTKAFETVCEYSTRYRIIEPNGLIRWVVIKAKPSFDASDETFLGFQGSLSSLTGKAVRDLKPIGIVHEFDISHAGQPVLPDDYLDCIADHIVAATSLIKRYRLNSALPGARSALWHVGRAIAKRHNRLRRLH